MEGIKIFILFSFTVTVTHGTPAFAVYTTFTDPLPTSTVIEEPVTTTDYPEYLTTPATEVTTDTDDITLETTWYPNVTESEPSSTSTDNWVTTEITTDYPEESTTPETELTTGTDDITFETTGYPNGSESEPSTTTDNWVTTAYPEESTTPETELTTGTEDITFEPTETTTGYPEETTTVGPVPVEANITYHLYNSKGRDFIYNSSSTEMFYLDDEVGTVVLIHSHAEDRFDRFSSNVLTAFENFHNFNVFVMDWSRLAPTYLDALDNLEIAANDLSIFLETVRNSKGAANNRQVHLVGFGTGAHLAGNAASNLYSDLPIGRITGLDPTRGTIGHNTSHVLSPADASYVEAIHTNGGNGESYGIGSRVAHVDFYPNGGERQPGCWSHACNHNRSWELFMATLEYNHHEGLRCLDMNQMIEDNCYGVPALRMGGVEFMKVPMLPGIYRLNTRNLFPF